MTDIIIKPKDYVKSVIEADNGLLYEIWDYFSFYSPNYQYTPKYKAGVWDGILRLFNLKTKEIYNGLLPKLVDKFCKDRGYKVSLKGDISFLKPKYVLEENYDFSKYTHFTPKWYQLEYLNKFFKTNRGLIISKTGSGKSLIIYLACRFILDKNPDSNILIIVTQTNLAEQMKSDFQEYTKEDISHLTNTIYSGKSKNNSSRIQISTWQSIYNMKKEWFDKFEFVICDEAHHATAKSIGSIIDKCGHVPLLMGLTGTIDETKHHDLDLTAKFGNIIELVNYNDLMKDGDLTELVIEMIRLEYSQKDCEQVQLLKTYDNEIKFIINNDRRNDFIIEKAVEQDENTLILFNYVEKHGKKLFDKMKPICNRFGKNLHYISGEIKVDEREEIRSALESQISWFDIEMNNDKILRIPFDKKVKLSDNKWKYPSKLTRMDTIDDEWLSVNGEYIL